MEIVKYPLLITPPEITFTEFHPTKYALSGLNIINRMSYQAGLNRKIDKYEEELYKIIQEIIKHSANEDDGMIKWYFNFDLREFHAKSPWLSCLTQGLMVSLFIRMYYLTRDLKFLEYCLGALKTLITPIDEGGTLYEDSSGTWLEEVAVIPPAHILNGFIYGIIALYDILLFSNYVKIPKEIIEVSNKVFRSTTNTVASNLKHYDLGCWSKYDLLLEKPAPPKYHFLHVNQLYFLYLVTNNSIFYNYSHKWLIRSQEILCIIKKMILPTIVYGIMKKLSTFPSL